KEGWRFQQARNGMASGHALKDVEEPLIGLGIAVLGGNQSGNLSGRRANAIEPQVLRTVLLLQRGKARRQANASPRAHQAYRGIVTPAFGDNPVVRQDAVIPFRHTLGMLTAKDELN